MGYWGGLIQGISEGSNQTRAENMRREEMDAAREAKVFEVLANSDDPEMQSLAITGMLHASNPKGKKSSSFFRRFLGEVNENPVMGQLRQAMGPGSAALPSQAAVEPGAPPMPPAMASPTGQPVTGPVAAGGPRRLFMTPMQKAVAQAQGSYSGRMTAALGAYRDARTPEERRLISGMSGAPERLTASQSVTLVYADGSSEAASYDPYANPGEEYTTAGGGRPVKPIKEVRKSGLASAGTGLRYFQDDNGNVTVVKGTEVQGEIPGVGRTGTAYSSAPPTPAGDRTRFDPRTGTYSVDPDAPPAPPAAQAGGPEQAEAAGIVAQAEREAQRMPSALGGGYQQGALDRAVQTVSKGKFKTYADAVAAARQTRAAGPAAAAPPAPPAVGPAAPGFDINAIRNRIQQNRQRVQ